ncbi:heterokaryon incompatibility protein-domain-containing protein [Dichotomopilus funicola]|uniref:Heterokaryon incompatibility protein-domain-containing protein n=1 Tax=Dichotomopilus funicola TaxID=1934379 RepID=A0AAN6V9J0_9PEZI|nr:heterokaryon incompatibility protein-domain-containing protein [Dichotomopilus funicola]
MLHAESDVIRAVQQLMLTTDVAQGFCGNCRHLLEHWPDLSTKGWARTVGRALDTKEIEAATRNGCKFCEFMLCRLRETEHLDIFRKLESRLRTLGYSSTASLSIQSVWLNDSLTLWMNFPGKIASHCNDYGARIKIESRVISPIRKAKDVLITVFTANKSLEQLWRENLDYFDLAKTWIDQCSTSHKWCGSEKSYARPTRLISIEDKSIKLILTDREKWETTPRYATLSYCWGRGEFTKLTPENLHSFLANIPLEGLPKTFQDAVYITRKLGLKYLWIDALCIIQDLSDDADWLREAALMCSVYGGSHVNLAATHATSVHGGCFLKQEHHVGGFCAPVTLTTASTGDHSMVRNFYFQMVYEISVTETHLAGRAWALQERLLAPRTLSFGEEGMFWECRSNTASEFLPDGFRGKIGPKLVRPENSAWSWSEIVSHYSNAALTFGTDRLPALSGIATRQREITGDDYLAGMWRRDLVTQLLWVVRNPQKRKERPKQWRAPSWSWISVDGPTYSYPGSVDELKQKQKEYIYVLEAWTTPAGPDPCGQVDGGELSVGCSALVHARVQRLPEPPRKVSGPRVLLETGTLPVTISVDCLDDEASLPDDGIVYLLPRCGDRKGHFRRIGSVDLCYDPFPDERLEAEKNRYYHELMAVIDRVGAVTAEAEAAKVVSNPDFPEARYVITIE